MIAVDKLITDQCARTPDKIAIKHGERTITYKQLNDITNQIARCLKNNGISGGDVVAVAIDRSPEMVLAIIAIVKTGGVYLPIDNGFPVDRIEYMLKDAQAKALITSQKLESRYAGADNKLFIEDILKESEALDNSEVLGDFDEDSVSYMLFTSGSTGRPKGVEVKHLGLTNFLLSMQKEPGMTADDIILNTTTISFDIAELEVYLPLITGATLILTDMDTVRDGRALLELARKEKLTIMQGTPFMWRTMLEAGWDERLDIKILCGGEALPKDLADRLVPRCRELWNMYGPTETTIWSLVKLVTGEDELITIGHVIDNTQIYVLDEQHNQLPDGEVGELYIGGDGVAKGYLNKPELTAERFIEDKFIPGDGRRIYKTGDLGKVLPNGEIQCLGRIDHQIKIRGYRIETEEIEVQLKQLGNIKEALINLYTDPLNNAHLVAYIVPEKKIESDVAELVKGWKVSLREIIPVYMVPDAFVFLDSIPLMANGKTNRNALPPPVISEYISTDFQEPGNKIESALLKICLKAIAAPKISVTDNFFDLGMDSLRAVSIMVQVEKQFGKRLPLSILLKYPTIRKFAHLIETGEDDWPYHSLIPIKPEGTKKPLYIVHGIGLNLLNVTKMVSGLDADQPVFGFQSIGLDGTMQPPDTIEEIAKFYIDELLAHNANGPYLIAGYSFGGIIAYEMAKQLKEMGKAVDLLIMFDTNLQIPSHQYPMGKKLAVKFIRQFKKAGYRIYTAFTQPGQLISYLGSDYKTRFNQLLSNVGLIDPDYHPESMPKHMQDIADKLNWAYHNYVVKPVDVKLVLFKAAVRMFHIDDPKYLGWGKYALKGVEVHNVPGDHKDMFQSDKNAAILAKSLQDRLNQA